MDFRFFFLPHKHLMMFKQVRWIYFVICVWMKYIFEMPTYSSHLFIHLDFMRCVWCVHVCGSEYTCATHLSRRGVALCAKWWGILLNKCIRIISSVNRMRLFGKYYSAYGQFKSFAFRWNLYPFLFFNVFSCMLFLFILSKCYGYKHLESVGLLFKHEY